MKVSVANPDQRLVVAGMTCVGTAKPWNVRGVLWNKIQVLKIFFSEIFLDVDCSHLNYSTPVAEEVLAAAKKVNILLSFKVSVVGSYWQSVFLAEKIEQKRRGWVDEADKKRKILRLPALHYAMKLHGRIGVGKAYDEGNICSVVLSHQLKGCSLSR